MNPSKRSVVLLGGGTGGHIFPLVSLKKALEKRGFSEFFWIGEGESLEERTATKERIPFRAIKSGKLRRYLSFKTLVEPLYIAVGFFQSLALLREIRPEFVFSKGGYVSLPAAMAAKILKIPTYLHESDAIPGLANRLVGRFSKTVFLGFSQAVKYFPKGRTVVVGQLLNPDVDWGAIRDSRNSDL
jgi:UDP-N-acetylglucosamine--N-acetylmuramyl-(pentapeptide) pyrophosphoryl-undecaprenol N-acetylglucosamine transferase